MLELNDAVQLLNLGLLCWNIALQRQCGYEDLLQHNLTKARNQFGEDAMIVIDTLVERKLKHLSEFMVLYHSVEVTGKEPNYGVSVATMPVVQKSK